MKNLRVLLTGATVLSIYACAVAGADGTPGIPPAQIAREARA